MNDDSKTIKELKQIVSDFIDDRDWSQFHDDPKNTLISLVIEAGELLEHFRFTTPKEARQKIKTHKKDIEDETADIFYNLLMFCQQNDIDLTTAFINKMKKVEKKYPASKFKGKNLKYTELEQ